MGTNSRFIGIAIREADKELYDWYKAQPGKATDVGRNMVEIARMFDGNPEQARQAQAALNLCREMFGENWQDEWYKIQAVARAM